MPIGNFVKNAIPLIIRYCEQVDTEEFNRLRDPEYSRVTFGLSSWAFFINVENINEENLETDPSRFWTTTYTVCGQTVRACSQWYERKRGLLLNYLQAKGIVVDAEEAAPDPAVGVEIQEQERETDNSVVNVNITNQRYKASHIGNAQNLAIRNILSNLGRDSFTAADWEATCNYFGNRCAYCGEEARLEIDHAVPINRTSLGEHRLGNLVPSCHACNSRKNHQDYREFLGENEERIRRIEQYMSDRNYTPIGDDERIRKVLEMAHEDIAAVANRYIALINNLFVDANE